jgi:hypothetical protein
LSHRHAPHGARPDKPLCTRDSQPTVLPPSIQRETVRV